MQLGISPGVWAFIHSQNQSQDEAVVTVTVTAEQRQRMNLREVKETSPQTMARKNQIIENLGVGYVSTLLFHAPQLHQWLFQID